MNTTPEKPQYDVVIVGGAIIGSSIAWFTSANPDFNGTILVVERDPSYEFSSTAATGSCTRQQFSNEINVRISQFGVDFLKNFRRNLGGDPKIPDIILQQFGYMYLADNQDFAEILQQNQKIQAQCGAATRIMTAAEIAAEYPFYNLDGILLGSHNPVDEGYFDGNTMFDWWKRKARQNGVQYIHNEVTAMDVRDNHVTAVKLASGETIKCGTVVNASGPRAVATAAMAGLELPVEPRRRFTFVFDAQQPLPRDLPLTIDPSGVHVRTEGPHYLCGCPPDVDLGVDFDDFSMQENIWEETIWPALAHRIPAFETVKVINSWVGHYAYNTLDQNAVIGRHPLVNNFIFANGFSGHGLQQSPAMGCGVSELISYGEFRTLDLGCLGYERILNNQPLLEKAVI